MVSSHGRGRQEGLAGSARWNGWLEAGAGKAGQRRTPCRFRLNLNRSPGLLHLDAASTYRPIPIFIGFDPRERAATNVLIDSLYQHSSQPLAITPIVSQQLEGVFHRERDPKQSTA